MNNENLKLNMEYRPKKFKDVVGQENVLKVLVGSLKTGRIQNAYLLEGDSGLGKTSLMRIFANSLICRNVDSNCEPCGVCEACLAYSTNPALVDVIEIDAGESGGVDKIRELKETLKYAPKERYRVIIIDEAHRLSKEGATALLKPIEEPPGNTVFMIATTESDKIMETIKNRCMKLKFNRIMPRVMVKRLGSIASNHNIKCEEGVLELIAVSSKGLMREAISLLEQISIMINDRTILKEDLKGIIDMENEYIEELISIIVRKDSVGLIDCIDRVANDITISDFDYIVNRIRKSISGLSTENYGHIVEIINIFIDCKNKCKMNVQPKVLLELACMKSIVYITSNNIDLNLFDRELEINDLDKSISPNFIVRDKVELFIELMSINCIEFEYIIESAVITIEDDVVYFTVSELDVKKNIINLLKMEFAQKLKPICDISGFVVRVR